MAKDCIIAIGNYPNAMAKDHKYCGQKPYCHDQRCNAMANNQNVKDYIDMPSLALTFVHNRGS